MCLYIVNWCEGLALEAHGLVKNYRYIKALQGLNVIVEPGSVVGLIGPNGAGKTTFIKIVMGLVRPDAGRIIIDGAEWSSRKARELLAYSPELPDAPPWETVCGLLEKLGWLEGLDRIEARKQAVEAAELLGVREHCDRKLSELSKGMRKRVLIAQALVPEWKRYYLLDEPMTGLDPEWVARVRDLIYRLKSRGSGILVSSHILSELEAVIDRVIIIKEGRTLFMGTLEELSSTVSRGPILVVKTSDTEQAVQQVKELGYKPVRGPGLYIKIPLTDEAEAEKILDLLRRNNVKILGYEVRLASLEEAYLSLLRGGGK